MNATAKETRTNTEFDQLKTRLKATWMTGDYDRFARYMEKDAEQFFLRQHRPHDEIAVFFLRRLFNICGQMNAPTTLMNSLTVFTKNIKIN